MLLYYIFVQQKYLQKRDGTYV